MYMYIHIRLHYGSLDKPNRSPYTPFMKCPGPLGSPWLRRPAGRPSAPQGSPASGSIHEGSLYRSLGWRYVYIYRERERDREIEIDRIWAIKRNTLWLIQRSYSSIYSGMAVGLQSMPRALSMGS